MLASYLEELLCTVHIILQICEKFNFFLFNAPINLSENKEFDTI